ncbi:nitrate reductase [Hoeflea sp. EC-HK425]|uniref:nitrate reductase n=1 Tax=Hoeflea sp. EC-HK425 TaxID=2038388 RepID=UPI0012522ABE|nr:nitrate reductase [Hoeflea sp. EC-HK425]VVT16453.1 Nitrate reductase [Hoeflea sp. EC-HK425]
MKSFVNPLAPRTNRLQVKSTEIRAWVRHLLDLPDGTPVSVVELACRDEGCPDIETVIGIMEANKPIRTIRVHVALAEVTRNAIAEAVHGDSQPRLDSAR